MTRTGHFVQCGPKLPDKQRLNNSVTACGSTLSIPAANQTQSCSRTAPMSLRGGKAHIFTQLIAHKSRGPSHHAHFGWKHAGRGIFFPSTPLTHRPVPFLGERSCHKEQLPVENSPRKVTNKKGSQRSACDSSAAAQGHSEPCKHSKVSSGKHQHSHSPRQDMGFICFSHQSLGILLGITDGRSELGGPCSHFQG